MSENERHQRYAITADMKPVRIFRSVLNAEEPLKTDGFFRNHKGDIQKYEF